MNNEGYQEPPPSYANATAKAKEHDPKGRAAAYAVPPPEQFGSVKYTAPNPTIPNIPNIQMNPMTKLGDQPVQCTCPNCHALIVTQTEQSSGILAWIICLVLVLFGCWLGCCLIPFCIRDLQNTGHYCPNCRALLGEYRLF